jgi:hypothetical protein
VSFDSEYIRQEIALDHWGIDDSDDEECPDCGECFEWLLNDDDEVVCPHCNALVWFWLPEAPQGVDEDEVPL